MQQRLREDPARLHRATARFLYASRELDRRLRRAPEGAIDTPTTLILAERDRIIHNERTAEAVRRLTGDRARIVRLAGAHTLEFEPDPSPLERALIAAVGATPADPPDG
jgi:alpha-beta hydrolase superfamily lysophospholipase